MSARVFDRWNPADSNSLPYAMYVAYSGELRKMYITMRNSKEYVYSSLKNDRHAAWTDSPKKFFTMPPKVRKRKSFFGDMKSWSDSFNSFENWNNQNVLLAVNSIFETYLVKILELALESNLGVLYGFPQKLDGMQAIKYGKKLEFSKYVENCTKGNWSHRISCMEKYFGKIPDVFKKECKTLEAIRNARNNVAHSFGRNLNRSHKAHDFSKLTIQQLKSRTLLRYWAVIDKCVQELDETLYKNHIGEYQILYFYHTVERQIQNEITAKKYGNTLNVRARVFRKMYGQMEKNGISTLGKDYCIDLVKYYESL